MFLTFRPDLKSKAIVLRKNMTPAEKKLWFEYLRTRPQKFLRQKPIVSYIVDFYYASKKLVIELDGDSHFVDEEEIERDRIRERFLVEQNSLREL